MKTETVSVVSYGGGVNSLAMLVGMHERLMMPHAIVFSDTRGEKPETYEHIEKHVRPWLRAVGFPELTVVCRADSDRTKTGDVFHWTNRIAAPLRDAREHVTRLSAVIGAENVRVDPEREAKIAKDLLGR